MFNKDFKNGPHLKKQQLNSQDRVICWHKDRHLDQWNGIERSEINLYIYGQLIFSEGAKTTQWGEDGLLNK